MSGRFGKVYRSRRGRLNTTAAWLDICRSYTNHKAGTVTCSDFFVKKSSDVDYIRVFRVDENVEEVILWAKFSGHEDVTGMPQ